MARPRPRDARDARLPKVCTKFQRAADDVLPQFPIL
jgi:hypothetical protein